MRHAAAILKDPSVWRSGDDVTPEALREHALHPDAAERAIEAFEAGATVSPFGGLVFRASLISLYRAEIGLEETCDGA